MKYKYKIRGDETLDRYVEDMYGEDMDWTLDSNSGELCKDAVAVDDFGNTQFFYIIKKS